MDRRTFIKTAGLGAACLAISASKLDAEERNKEILSRADERIEKYRMTSASLKVFGPDVLT